jgi:peptidoglycan/LPS O-acetylase OafA/YrhL
MAEKKDIRPLTGLRGVAALYVMFFHYSGHFNNSNPFDIFVYHGYLAVDLFFCLSGFVMALSYSKMFAESWSLATYWKFLGRRIARVYPLYLVGTIAGFILVTHGWLGSLHFDFPGISLALNVLMIQTWGLIPSFNSYDSPTWSLSAEWAAYLSFPLILFVTLKRRPSLAWISTVLCVGVIAMLPWLREFLGDKTWLPGSPLDIYAPWMALPVLRCLPEFMLGVLAYRAAFTPLGIKIAENRWASSILLVVTLGLMAVPNTDVLVVLLFVVMLITLSSESSKPAKLLSSPLAQLAGQLSYSIYLTHYLFLGVLYWTFGSVRQLGLAHAQTYAAAFCVALTLPTAYLLYAYFEVPSRKYLRHVFEGRKLGISIQDSLKKPST